MRNAFKEWAIVVDALGRGDQILILRKGGIAEGRDGFRVDHQNFLLFPTLYHQQRDCVTPGGRLGLMRSNPRGLHPPGSGSSMWPRRPDGGRSVRFMTSGNCGNSTSGEMK